MVAFDWTLMSTKAMKFRVQKLLILAHCLVYMLLLIGLIVCLYKII